METHPESGYELDVSVILPSPDDTEIIVNYCNSHNSSSIDIRFCGIMQYSPDTSSILLVRADPSSYTWTGDSVQKESLVSIRDPAGFSGNSQQYGDYQSGGFETAPGVSPHEYKAFRKAKLRYPESPDPDRCRYCILLPSYPW